MWGDGGGGREIRTRCPRHLNGERLDRLFLMLLSDELIIIILDRCFLFVVIIETLYIHFHCDCICRCRRGRPRSLHQEDGDGVPAEGAVCCRRCCCYYRCA